MNRFWAEMPKKAAVFPRPGSPAKPVDITPKRVPGRELFAIIAVNERNR